MKVKCQVCSSKFLGEKEKEKNSYILFYWAQRSNLIIVLKISLITSWTQINS